MKMNMKMKMEDFGRGLSIVSHKAELILTHMGHKVIPVSSDATPSSTEDQNGHSNDLKERKGNKVSGSDDHTPQHKAKALVRMKELVKKAAAAKTEKAGKYIGRKVLYFRNKGVLRSVTDDDGMSSESPKISFRWDMESHSTTTSSCLSRASSSFKKTHMPSKLSMDCSAADLMIQDINKLGSWITTDSECSCGARAMTTMIHEVELNQLLPWFVNVCKSK